MNPVIGIDLDDVLFDFIGHFFSWHNQRYGTNLTFQDMTRRKLWQVWGGTQTEAAERIPAFFREVDMLRLAPIAGAVEALQELRDRYRLAVISARDPAALAPTQQWLEHYFAGLFDQVELGLSNPLDQDRPMTKAEFCQLHGIGLLVDDQLSNAEACAQAGIRVLLYGDLPWNQSARLPGGVERVPDWAAVRRALVVPS